MSEGYGAEYGADTNRPDYDSGELARIMKEKIDTNGGEYSESLEVSLDGRILLERRRGDDWPAFLPFFVDRNGEAPTIEDIYYVLKDIADKLPEYEVSIGEDRTARNLRYSIRRRANQL